MEIKDKDPDKEKTIVKRIINKTSVKEDLLYEKQIEWIGEKTEFVEFAYALYQTKAVRCIGRKMCKEIFINNLADFFGIDDIHNHAILHTHRLSKAPEEHFPYRMAKSYEDYLESLLEKGGLFDKKKKSHKEYFIEEDEAEESKKEYTKPEKQINAMAKELTSSINKEIEHIEIILEEIPPKGKPQTQSAGTRKPPKR